MPEPEDPTAEKLRRRRGRNLGVVTVLLLLAAMLYGLGVVKLVALPG